MARDRDTLAQVLGKTIIGVILSENATRGPRSAMHLIFSDATSFEIWASEGPLSIANGLDDAKLDQVLANIRRRAGTKVEYVFIDPSHGVVQKDFWVAGT